jgi:hypothetical protein
MIVENFWKEFEHEVLRNDFSPIQKREMKKAFFCGAGVTAVYLRNHLLDFAGVTKEIENFLDNEVLSHNSEFCTDSKAEMCS